MTKYSTGGGSHAGEGGACELCGSPSDTLQSATIAGASLAVCRSCAPHDDRGPASSRDRSKGGGGDRRDTGRKAAQRVAKFVDASRGDPTHWEEHGTNYEDDRLPYLVSGYGDRVKQARRNSGLTIDELAESIEGTVSDIEAVEQARAARAGVGGSVIRALEESLEIELIEQT